MSISNPLSLSLLFVVGYEQKGNGGHWQVASYPWPRALWLKDARDLDMKTHTHTTYTPSHRDMQPAKLISHSHVTHIKHRTAALFCQTKWRVSKMTILWVVDNSEELFALK